MSTRIKKTLAMSLCLCLLLTTACGSGEQSKDMGRYVEELLDYPIENANIWSMLQRTDGSLDIYMSKLDNNEVKLYNTQDGKKWTEKKINVNFLEEEVLQDVFYNDKDQAFLNMWDYSTGSRVTKIYRISDDGTMMHQKMYYQDENGDSAPETRIDDFKITKSGKFIGTQNGRVVQYSAEGKYERSYGSSEKPDDLTFAIYGNIIYVLDKRIGLISAYDTEKNLMEELETFKDITDRTGIASTKDGNIYLYNEKGIFRLDKGRKTWKKVVNGDLTSLSVPSLLFTDLVEGADGNFYLTLEGGGKSQLVKYTYDKTIATLPEKELVIYTLSDNKMLRQAMGEFQRSHPDTKINIQIGISEGNAASKSEIIRSLNAELLNKKGPDILLLDGMPIENYIEKDVLLDLSDVLKELDSENTLNKGVKNTYQYKNGVYAIPTKYAVTMLLTSNANLVNSADLKSVARFAQQNPDLPLIGDKSVSHLISLFLPSCAPAWIKNGKIKEKELSECLQYIKMIADSGSKSYELKPENIGVGVNGGGELGLGAVAVLDTKEEKLKRLGDLFSWAYGRSHAAILLIADFDSLIYANAAKSKKQEEGVLGFAPGQVKNSFIPMSIVGVNANSKDPETAKDFVKLMLSESVQNVKLSDGFAVNREVLKKQASEVDNTMYIGTTSPFDENERFIGSYPPKEELAELFELYEAVKTPFVTDSMLMEMIIDETEEYFTGKKDINKTMEDIKESTKLYLSE